MFILGFTDEDVTGSWQHWRLATECGCALEAEGFPISYGLREAAGEGRYFLYWYLQDDLAAILDRHGVGWRRFLVGHSAIDPGRGHSPLKSSTKMEREALEERRRAAHKVAR
jgi:hypothetical protein